MHLLAVLKNLKVWQKLAFLSGILIIPIMVLGFLFINSSTNDANFIEKELQGLKFITELNLLVRDLHTRRELASNTGAKPATKEEIEAVDTLIDGHLTKLDEITKGGVTLPGMAEAIKKFKDSYAALKGMAFPIREKIFEQHNLTIKDAIAVITEAGIGSNLILDPILVSYLLQDNIGVRIPDALETMARCRVQLAMLAKSKKLDESARADLLLMIGQLEHAVSLITGNSDLAKIKDNPKELIFPKFESSAKLTNEKITAYLDFVKKALAEGKGDSLNTDTLRTLGMDAEAALSKLAADKSPILEEILSKRYSSESTRLTVAVIVLGLSLGLTLSLVYLLTSSINQQVSSIGDLFNKIGTGDFSARSRVYAQDELGTMAGSLNAMLDNTQQLIQSREERDQIQRSITKLLEEVSGVADGDLTQEAEVTADITGAIADSFNYMIGQLRQVIGDVQKTTNQVREYAGEIYNSTQELTDSAETQAKQIVDTSSQVDQMTLSIQEVSRSASLSASVADQALANARQGNSAVQDTIAGMDRIRDQVQETAKRIKRLGESSQEIGQIIQLIDDIADRTSILALNASIQAAMAGEAGRGFAVVAEEVERLADRSTEATKKIAGLVKTIQSETNEAVGAMEKGIQEVIEGSKLATQAGQALVEIESVSQKLASLIQNISTTSKQQAQASEGVSKAMSDISEITQHTASGTRQTADAVSSLASLAEKLRASVVSFRLPGGGQMPDVFIGQSSMSGIELKGTLSGMNGSGSRSGKGESVRY